MDTLTTEGVWGNMQSRLLDIEVGQIMTTEPFNQSPSDAQHRLNKYMKMRDDAKNHFMKNPSLLRVCVALIEQLEVDIRQCRKELGLPEWGYL